MNYVYSETERESSNMLGADCALLSAHFKILFSLST